MRPPDLTGNSGALAAYASDSGSNKQQNSTGRHTVLFRQGATQQGIEFFRRSGWKVYVTNASDPQVVREDQVGDADVIVFPKLGVALVDGEPEKMNQLKNLANDSSSPILTIKPERVRRMLEISTEASTADDVLISMGYLRGCRDTYTNLLDNFGANRGSVAQLNRSADVAGFDESQITWGLQATKVIDSSFSGRGVKVAVLDTGIDFTIDENEQIKFHPDFEGRKIHTASFVFGVQSAQDGQGHGTHCIGTACGPRTPSTLPGYGVAYEAEIYAGKVLNDAGSGADGWILNGIEWAVNQGCRIISMSLGAPKSPGDTFNELFEEVAQRALKAGTVIIAAAGNDSARPGLIRPVSGPADCPSILGVAALDPNLQIASFSNRGINSGGGEVNIAAPGVSVHSSFLRPPGHRRLQGTSMATPHVAGIAALFAEANPLATASQLTEMITKAARQLSFDARDVGRGLVQAPGNNQPNTSSTRDSVILEREPPPEGFTILQSSPITIGGGGSVGLDFDATRYRQNGSGSFVSPEETLSNCDVVHQNGKLLRNFHPEIDGQQCVVIIKCRDTSTGTFSDIRIAGGPSGPLGIGFIEEHFPPGVASQPRRFSERRKVVSVEVTNSVTGATTGPFNVGDDWAGTIRINN